jgi:hypothetical protein
MLPKFILVLAVMLLVGCSGDQDREVGQAGQVGPIGHQLLFFLDPGGRPCQMQDQILQNLAGDLKNRVDLRYVQTTVAEDRRVFYKYGIRALPTLVLADASGSEIGRLPPGVKGAEDIRALISTIPGS